MNKFTDTIPVLPRKGPVQITPDEGDALIRASWPPRRAAEPGIDYAAHTSECADCDDGYEEPPMPVWAGWLMVAIMLASSAAMVSLIVWVLP
jgi:hypothetical protein